MRRQVSFYPPEPLHDRLLELADKERRKVAAMVLLLVEEALAARSPRTLAEGGVADTAAASTGDGLSGSRRDTDERRAGLGSRSLDVPPSASAHKRTVTPDPRKP